MSKSGVEEDYSIRAMTDDHAFRVVVARTTGLVRSIIEAQGAEGATRQTLGDLLTGTVLFRETMAPGLRVQGILRSEEAKVSLIADSAPEGKTRGLIQGPANKQVVAAEGSTLHMMRTLHNGSVNQGIVRIAPDAQPSVGAGLMTYMQESEQVDSMLALCTALNEAGEVVEAGGYMVQLLPEVGKGPLAVMAERLEDFRTIEHMLTRNFKPETLLDELLYAMPFTLLDRSELSFTCWCSESRLLAALATLAKEEIRSMIEDGEPLEIGCDYCNKNYLIRPTSLHGLIDSN